MALILLVAAPLPVRRAFFPRPPGRTRGECDNPPWRNAPKYRASPWQRQLARRKREASQVSNPYRQEAKPQVAETQTTKRRQARGSAWHWRQTDCWYYTQPGTKKRMPLVDEKSPVPWGCALQER